MGIVREPCVEPGWVAILAELETAGRIRAVSRAGAFRMLPTSEP